MRYFFFLLAIFVLVGCSETSTDDFREDLYDDTRQLSGEIRFNKTFDDKVTKEQEKLFIQYKDKYSDANGEELELIDQLMKVKDLYEVYLSDESQLKSEDPHELQYLEASIELSKLIGKVNDKYQFYTDEEREEDRQKGIEMLEEMEEQGDID